MIKIDPINHKIDINGFGFEGPNPNPAQFPDNPGPYALFDTRHNGNTDILAIDFTHNLKSYLSDRNFQRQWQAKCYGDLEYAYMDTDGLDILPQQDLVARLNHEIFGHDNRHGREYQSKSEPILQPSLTKLSLADTEFVGPVTDFNKIPSAPGIYIVADLLPCEIEAPVRIDIADNMHTQIMSDSKEEWFFDRIFGSVTSRL